MKTEVIMVRFIEDREVRQKSKSELFSANDLLRIINRKRVEDELPTVSFHQYMQIHSTKEFINELSIQQNKTVDELIYANKKNGTWVHPYIFLDIALWAYPKLKVKVYEWIHDSLLQYRNKSGDSFKEMNIALDAAFNIGGRYWIYAQVANKIADYCKVGFEDDRWNTATQEQLQLRDAIQNAVITVCESGFVPADSDIEKFIETIYRNEYRKLLKAKKIS